MLAAYLVFHLWFFSRPRTGRIGSKQVLQTFYRARPWQYLVLLLMKTPNLFAAVTVYWLTLPCFGLHVPFTDLLTYLPSVGVEFLRASSAARVAARVRAAAPQACVREAAVDSQTAPPRCEVLCSMGPAGRRHPAGVDYHNRKH